MAIQHITVRMYRRLLGDCFLIRIAEDDGARHILIDCGLLQGLSKAGDRMQAIAADIAKTTGGHLDLLVVTHEHWDHISGFAQAREVFFDPAKLHIDRLWMAWTENPDDPDAARLRQRFDSRQQALAAFALAMDGSKDPEVRALLDGLENFLGPNEVSGGGLGVVPGGRLSGRRILDELKKAAAKTDYLAPGQVVDTPGTTPLRVAVLGPPRNETRLFKDSPSAGSAKETYLAEDLLAQSFLAVDAAVGDAAALSTASPFAERYWKGLGKAEVEAAGDASAGTAANWLHAHYFADLDPAEGREQGFRRIDGTGSNASALALKLDSDTNNTSLVLAFELPDGSFMLFAADAQVGNWLSWHDQDYPLEPRLSAEQILNRTRLYKVGHHGSHNATLNAKGLAMMTREDLVAMVSTVEAEAKEQGRPPGWLMPNPDVAVALYEQCGGRVIIGDRDWHADETAQKHGDQPGFAAALDEASPLYVEYTAWRAAAA